MNALINTLVKTGLLEGDVDYHLVRASMVVLFLFFGYQKWFDYEVQGARPLFEHGPLISWMYPVFGHRGASWLIGVSEWTTCALLFLGFWNKRLGLSGPHSQSQPSLELSRSFRSCQAVGTKPRVDFRRCRETSRS